MKIHKFAMRKGEGNKTQKGQMLILDCNSGFYYKILNFLSNSGLVWCEFLFLSLSFLLKTKTQNQTSE